MTTYYFIRHGEKERNGQRDPHLTANGKRMAKKWCEILKDKGIERVYCTALQRTQETAQPLLDKLGLEYQHYSPSALYSKAFQEETQGKTVLIVGHQDTTPAFVNRILGIQKYPYIKSHNHGNLYKVSVHENGSVEAQLRSVSF